MSHKTNIMEEFNILGDYFDLDDCTNSLKLAPDESFYKNDEIKGRDKRRIETCWSINTTERID